MRFQGFPLLAVCQLRHATRGSLTVMPVMSRCSAQICTEVLARGIDVKHISCVVNYDFPQTIVSYIHRVGRTGRAGRSGKAITFFTEQDREFVRPIAQLINDAGG
eukprot:COSAG05_NODE_9576_length_614_cov_14158.159223_1_plen_104_part_10